MKPNDPGALVTALEASRVALLLRCICLDFQRLQNGKRPPQNLPGRINVTVLYFAHCSLVPDPKRYGGCGF